MINVTTLILKLSISHFWIVMFLVLHSMESISRASSYVADFNIRNKLLTQTLLNKAIGIINFTKHFQNFIDNTMI